MHASIAIRKIFSNYIETGHKALFLELKDQRHPHGVVSPSILTI